ncbi:hypothetical protein D3C73_895230 [compost metagenome]
MIGADVAQAACQHDRFVVATQLNAVVAIDALFISTEVTDQRRATKLVIECRTAQWAFGHDIQRGDDAIRFAEILFPRLFEPRNTQVGNREPYQASFRLRATAGCAFVADFTARTGRSAWPRRDRRWVVVGFHLHQDVCFFLMIVIQAALRRGKEAPHLGAFHHRRVVFIGRKHVVRRLLKGIFDHFEQRLRLLFAVDDPVGVENLMAAMFGVGLCEHVQLNIRWVAPQLGKGGQQVVDLVLRQCQP